MSHGKILIPAKEKIVSFFSKANLVSNQPSNMLLQSASEMDFARVYFGILFGCRCVTRCKAILGGHFEANFNPS